MTAALKFQVCVFVFCIASVLTPSTCHDHSTPDIKHKAALFIFGDSTFDVGNNNYINTSTLVQANFPPYGETFFKRPTGRFSDGRLICDFIAEYAKLPLIPPYLQPGFDDYTYGVNFASSGAGILPESFQGLVIDVPTQLGYFKEVEKQLRHKLGDAETHKLLSKAVYLFGVGASDYAYADLTNSSLYESSSEEFVGLVIGNLTNMIKEIYKKGGRKFAFKDVGPLGCSPSMREFKPGNTGTCVEEINEVAKIHHRVLSEVLLQLKGDLQGFEYSFPNFYTLIDDIINNPTKYGFEEGKIACCGSGQYNGRASCGGKRDIGDAEYELCDNVDDYVFFDADHATEKFSRKLAKLWWSHPKDANGTTYQLKELFEA